MTRQNSPTQDRLLPRTVAILGVPYDENSTFMRGAALGPPSIRQALNSGSANMCAESERDLGSEDRFRDVGDLSLGCGEAALDEIQSAVDRLLEQGARVLALGGDHSITLPILRAYAKRYDRLSILHLDAHPDLYDEFDGNRYSHACPFARILEQELAVRLVQVGIRTMNPHQRAQAERFGVEVLTMQDRAWQKGIDFDGPVYLSLDLDVLDPAFAPGVAHHEPGGLSTRDVLNLIQAFRGPLVGADIVELNPKRDPVGITAMAAAKLLKEIADRMLAAG
jgi:arginase